MSQMQMPIVSIVTGGADDEMSDLQFLAIKENQGKTRHVQGTRITTGDVISITAGAGKDMYLAGAKVSISSNNSSNIESAEVGLKINGVDGEFVTIANVGGSDKYQYILKGQKVAAGQIIKLQVYDITNSPKIHGVIYVWEENTGATPQIPPLNPV